MKQTLIKTDSKTQAQKAEKKLTFNIVPFLDINEIQSSTNKKNLHYYEIIWILNGEGYRVVDFEEFPIKPHRLFFMSPGSVHLWKNTNNIDGIHIIFSEEFLLYTWQHSFPTTIPFIDIEDTEHIYELLDLIKRENELNSENKFEIISSYLKILLSKLLHSPSTKMVIDNTSLVGQFEQLLEKYFSTHHYVEDYAKIVHLSPNYLNDLIKSKTGKSVGLWIRKRRLIESKRKLLFTTDSISKISSDLHFNDISYFCRFFKKYTNQSPLQFRRFFEHSTSL
jgi:AraC family transcriptional regulator, transcriptional activator of pobA